MYRINEIPLLIKLRL